MTETCVRCNAPGSSFCSDCQREEEELERQREERRQRTVPARRHKSGVPFALTQRTFEDVADTRPDVLDATREWASSWDWQGSGLLLAGPVGVGKTWLAAAAAEAWLQHAELRWFSVPALFQLLELPFGNERREEAVEALAALKPGDALVLDDIDKARATEHAAEQLIGVVDHCVNECVALLVTTNLELSALAARFPEPYGEAIVSRLAGYCDAFVLHGHDRRLDRHARRLEVVA